MEIKVPLSHFTDHIAKVKKQKRHIHLDEVEWLVNSFRFSDTEAIYEPEPEDGPFMDWWRKISRN